MWEVGFARKRACFVTEASSVTGQPQGKSVVSAVFQGSASGQCLSSPACKREEKPGLPPEGCCKAPLSMGAQVAGGAGVSFSGREAPMSQLC